MIEIVLFNRPVQRIGITGAKIYSSFLFPTFISAASTLLVTHSSLPGDNCQSLSTISIPVQPSMESNIYFIEFLFTGGSSVHQLNWLHLGEIRFSDETHTVAPIVKTEANTENEEGRKRIIITNKGRKQDIYSITDATIISQLSPTVTSGCWLINTSDLIPSCSSVSTNEYLATKINDNAQSRTDPTIVPIQVATNSESEMRSSVSTTITVAALAGVIGLLTVLLMGVCGFFLCIFFYTRKRKRSLLEAPQNHNIDNLATAFTLHDKQDSIPMFTNSCYQKYSSLLVHELPDPLAVYCYPEVYSDDRGSGQYDDIAINYYDDIVIPEDVKPSCGKESISDNGKSIPIASRELAPRCGMPNESENSNPSVKQHQ